MNELHKKLFIFVLFGSDDQSRMGLKSLSDKAEKGDLLAARLLSDISVLQSLNWNRVKDYPVASLNAEELKTALEDACDARPIVANYAKEFTNTSHQAFFDKNLHFLDYLIYLLMSAFADKALKESWPVLLKIARSSSLGLSTRSYAVDFLAKLFHQPFNRKLKKAQADQVDDLLLEEIAAWEEAGCPGGQPFTFEADPALLNPQTPLEKICAHIEHQYLLRQREASEPFTTPSSYFAICDRKTIERIQKRWSLPADYLEFLSRFSPVASLPWPRRLADIIYVYEEGENDGEAVDDTFDFLSATLFEETQAYLEKEKKLEGYVEIGRESLSGHSIVLKLAGSQAGSVSLWDHDDFAFTHLANSFVEFLSYWYEP